MLAFALAAWLIFYISFSAKYSIFWSLIALICGLISVAIVGYVSLKYTINLSARFLNESIYSRGRAYSFGWGSGTAIGAGILSLTISLFTDLTPVARSFMLKDEDLTDSDK